ncbi:phage tail protein [uncultured Mediterranean phage uvMED]|nr:phage tail protein [uncultured Mediterranean phage uvMED]
MTQTKYVVGAGGGGGGKGGGGRSTPTEQDDTLQSTQFANVLDLISEGEIGGLEDGNKSIFLDDTPVQAADGTNNFEGFTIVTRVGTQGQTHLAGPFNATERETAVGVEVTNGTSVTRSITDTDVDRLRVTLTIPSLQVLEDDGDVVGNSVQIKIQIQYNSGGYNDVITDTISGKSSNRYQRDYLVNLTGSFPVDVRMVRVSADETSQKRASSTIFQSFTEIIDDKFRYPNSALVGLRFDSRQFSSIPTRKYLIRGIKVKIPSNATVDTTTHLGRITYSGIWDGTFQAATWTNDPAWCLYDLLISERFGAGVPESTLDKYDFFAISQYCNALVSDGAGGQEPRFSLNILINSRDEVYNVIQQMTAIFRGIAYYGAGTLQLLQDKPSDPQYLLSPSNVVDGIFQYQGTSQKARHTVVVVAWQSYDTRGDVEYEYVEDHDAVAKYGIIKKDIKAIGCYSQGQAHRIGKWTLLSEQNLTETIQFSVALESGIILRPGMVIDVADPVRAGARRSGRVKSATTTQITTDSSNGLTTSLAAANNPKLSVMLSTGLVEQKDVPVGGITLLADGTAEIDVASAFSEAPATGSVFLFQNDEVQSQQFRVVSVAEAEEGIYGVSAVAYNSTIYDAVEADVELTNRDISNLSLIPNPVDSVSTEEFLYEEANGVFVGASVSWNHDRVNVSEFRVQYRIDNDNWQAVDTASPSVTLRSLRAGRLYVQIQAKNSLNKGSQITIADFELQGKTAAPAAVTNFSMIPVNGQARLTWTQSTDLDVRVGGYVRLRHSPDLSGVTWPTSTSISEQISGSATEAYADLKAGTYSAKFVDSGGRESLTAALIEFTKADLQSVEVVGALGSTEDPSFSGTKTNLVVDTANNELELATTGSELAAIGDFDLEDGGGLLLEDDSNLDLQGDDEIHQSGTYVFNSGNTFTLSDVFSLRLDSTLRARSFFPYGERIDDEPNFDLITEFDGTAPNTCDVELYIRTTQDDPAGSPTFTSWRRFNNAEFKARGYQVKAEFSTGGPQEQIAVDQLRVQAAMPIRTITGTVTTSTSADVSVTYGAGKKFYVTPAVGIAFNAQTSNEHYVVSNSTATGFDLSVYHGTNQRVARDVTWTATGYGIG